ncbi:putative regulator of septum formation [Sediminihabitans luteus]|uniref:Putative regulator of septum formation n=1 Tax=Sediminihabitans luteus TaxID=1138585 RepID=A0A2M9D0R1_9CELL|nr:septum formation family protein [Sediminihabitans luteus]PJJ77665.1 putative regulator of septum formation [Sediminihabitans luteus]GII98565.1 hypothetical protein Slu03_09430 [Sediminihabitans luteus]
MTPDEHLYPAPHRAPGWAPEPDVAATAGRRRRTARTVALAAAGLVVVAGATWAGLAWSHHASTAPLPADVASPTSAASRQLVLGSCLATLPDDGALGRVDVVPCADAHEAQVVARTDWSDAAVWPGERDAQRRAARVCTDRTLTADGVDPAEFRLVLWIPTEASWADGDRTALCVAAGESREGSLLD